MLRDQGFQLEMMVAKSLSREEAEAVNEARKRLWPSESLVIDVDSSQEEGSEAVRDELGGNAKNRANDEGEKA